ncbi:hypothetical protein L3Q82_019112, partial [Scortum barcoo]
SVVHPCVLTNKEPREAAPSLGKRPLNAMRSICDAVKQCHEVYENRMHLAYLVYTKTLKGDTWWYHGADCVEKFVHRFRRLAFRDTKFCFTDPDFQLKYIDSLSFLPMRLSAFPKALGFPDQSKGHFPHGFSSRERLNYVGPYPPSGDYGLERMSAPSWSGTETRVEECSKGSSKVLPSGR